MKSIKYQEFQFPKGTLFLVTGGAGFIGCDIKHSNLDINIAQQMLGIAADNLHIVDPMGYLEFNYMVKHCKAVITDSGGITEETTVMGIPCITLRDNTERPETCTVGTNELIGTNPDAIKPALDKLFVGQWKKGGIPELWDGKTAERIVGILTKEN